MMAQGVATVERLRVRTADTTRTTPRRVAALVRASHVRPAALPAAAVLVVGSLKVTVSGVVPGPASAGELQRVLGSGVDAALKTASRPRGCVVDPSAAAVLFDDEAHLLACALRLRLHGRPRAWWSAHLRRIDGSVASLLGHDVRLLPAVVDRLDGAGDAGRLVAALPDAIARDLTTGVLVAFGLPAVLPSSAPDATAASPLGSPADTPGSRLLALGLRIIRTPASLHRVAQEGPGEPPGPSDPAPTPPHRWNGDHGGIVVPAGPRTPPEADPGTLRRLSRAQEVAPAARPAPPVPDPDAGAAGPTATSAGREPRPQAPPGRPGRGEAARRRSSPGSSAAAPGVPSAPPRGSRPRDAAPAGSPAPAPAVPPPAEAALSGVATGLAGIVYLIPLLERLAWPDDAEPAWRLDRLGGWTQLGILARRLLTEEGCLAAEEAAAVARDPLWGLLASLDGRRPDEVPPDGTVPDAAVRTLGDRLAGALDMSPEHAVAVLRTPGRVTFTTTHVDVVMALDDISLPVRLAGLDRTPGWVPRLGRVVTVTFREHV